jgi:hypothetical protein
MWIDTSPILEYFDGVDWRPVPTTEHYGFEEEEIPLDPDEKHVFYYSLAAFDHPESGLFRLRRAVYVGERWERTYHDLVFEFTLE